MCKMQKLANKNKYIHKHKMTVYSTEYTKISSEGDDPVKEVKSF